MKVYISAYNLKSKSFQALREGLSGVESPLDLVINWGRGYLGRLIGMKVLNPPELVARAVNKLTFFNLMSSAGEAGPRIPYYTEDISEARTLMDYGPHVVVRQVLTGHSGKGIVYCSRKDQLPGAPLYVEYINKSKEFRVHFVKGRAPFVQRKMKRRNTVVDFLIWNRKNNYVYASKLENIKKIPDDVLTQAEKAFTVSELDFGAVDVVWDGNYKEAYVLEINTAPGLQGQTLQYYVEGLTNLIKGINSAL